MAQQATLDITPGRAAKRGSGTKTEARGKRGAQARDAKDRARRGAAGGKGKQDRKPELDRKAGKADKRKGKGKKSRKDRKRRGTARPELTAATADRHDLYQRSVQAPDEDARFVAKYYRKYTGEPLRLFREDFAGTAILAATFVQRHRDNRAIAVDFDRATLDWGAEHVHAELRPDQRERLEIHCDDVRAVHTPGVELIAAFNFSYMTFQTRDLLRGYFEACRRSLKKGGMLLLDLWGGSETQVEQEEERDIDGEFTYVWDQHSFDPTTYESTCKIHFLFHDGSEMRSAFEYTWRLWTMPEVKELLAEAGFSDIHHLWEGTDKKTNEGNNQWRRREGGDADPSWIAYVVGIA